VAKAIRVSRKAVARIKKKLRSTKGGAKKASSRSKSKKPKGKAAKKDKGRSQKKQEYKKKAREEAEALRKKIAKAAGNQPVVVGKRKRGTRRLITKPAGKISRLLFTRRGARRLLKAGIIRKGKRGGYVVAMRGGELAQALSTQLRNMRIAIKREKTLKSKAKKSRGRTKGGK
jgi:hypothetical protein